MPLTQAFSTTGRLSRSGFWLHHLTTVPLGLWLTTSAGHWPGPPWDALVAAALVLMLVSIWGRRLHDRGRSAWWLLAAAVPVVGAVGLIVQCGFLPSGAAAQRFDSGAAPQPDYLTVTPADARLP